MLFNSPEFLLFLPIVFGLYWFVANKNLKAQNALILSASYFFYGWWDWRFLGLIALSTLVDYTVGLQINKHRIERNRKQWLWVSVLVNLGLLGYFKYTNFFIKSWIDAWNSLGIEMQTTTLQIILPVGISFYTFQTLSYTIDIYRGQLQPTRSLLNFATFVSFFPQLVAGPIERAAKLLPQIESKRVFKYEEGVTGLRLILWGLFKKVAIADNCAIFVNDIFANYPDYSGPTLILGMVLFAFQIYGDFSGYSDIAIGTAKLFGIQLMTNFKTPFLSKSIPEFWNRWHISLSSWLNDYVFFPMAFTLRKHGKSGVALAVFFTFLVSGLWHGADWKYVVFGGLHGLIFLPYVFLNHGPVQIGTGRIDEDGYFRWHHTIRNFGLIAFTFSFNLFAWVFFRADSVSDAMSFFSHLMKSLDSEVVFDMRMTENFPIYLCIFILAMYESKGEGAKFMCRYRRVRWSIYLFLIFLIIAVAQDESSTFIYFQF